MVNRSEKPKRKAPDCEQLVFIRKKDTDGVTRFSLLNPSVDELGESNLKYSKEVKDLKDEIRQEQKQSQLRGQDFFPKIDLSNDFPELSMIYNESLLSPHLSEEFKKSLLSPNYKLCNEIEKVLTFYNHVRVAYPAEFGRIERGLRIIRRYEGLTLPTRIMENEIISKRVVRDSEVTTTRRQYKRKLKKGMTQKEAISKIAEEEKLSIEAVKEILISKREYRMQTK